MDKDYLILKRASASRPSGEWNDDDFDMLADGVVVGRIFKVHAAPVGTPWMWTLGRSWPTDQRRTCRVVSAELQSPWRKFGERIIGSALKLSPYSPVRLFARSWSRDKRSPRERAKPSTPGNSTEESTFIRISACAHSCTASFCRLSCSLIIFSFRFHPFNSLRLSKKLAL